ncbi:hypothetical protein PsYK624_167810 [Phanerochaete sordida]|uniref:Uncharacterized protein n=1 Tax=Phanerochaete sordida TaxID=48140 RepID=A0A9P3GSM6_9APHY|nr:hypothetical protein PsYK624_167810 [Phanerochaete sordida]
MMRKPRLREGCGPLGMASSRYTTTWSNTRAIRDIDVCILLLWHFSDQRCHFTLFLSCAFATLGHVHTEFLLKGLARIRMPTRPHTEPLQPFQYNEMRGDTTPSLSTAMKSTMKGIGGGCVS